MIDQHRSEIRELQFKLDDCVSETRRLDLSVRAAAECHEQKETEQELTFKKLSASHEQLNQSYKKLLTDHEELQKILLQLESDYDHMYGELSRKHMAMNELDVEMGELKEKYRATLDTLNNTELKLNTYTSRSFADSAVNTLDSESYLSREELEKFYEMKFNELNGEINQLKDKVSPVV